MQNTNSESAINRRAFLKYTSAGAMALGASALTARSQEHVAGANDRIRVGQIGCGSRGSGALMPECHEAGKSQNAQIVAVCDPWNQQREAAAAKVKEWFGPEPRQYKNYKELLDQKDIDAVMIASCDHQHARMLAEAARAGKDVYCEKPWAMEIQELNEAVDAVKQHNRIVQAGTQLRSMDSFTGCRDFVQSGKLGKVLKVEQVRNGYRPYWHSYVRPIKESDTDWRLFLMHKPFRPWDPDQYSAWYGYRDFSSGPIGGFMSHFIDLVHYLTGARFPSSAVALGGIYVWKDARTCPDSVQALLEYPEGFLVSYSTAFGNGSGSYTRFYGTRGSIDASNWGRPIVSGEGSDDPNRIEVKEPVPPQPRMAHMEDWLSCVRSRQQPNANVDAGYQHGVACILADMAYVTGRRMVYDPVKREIRPG